MNSPNISPYVVDSWVRSGQAAEAAQELAKQDPRRTATRLRVDFPLSSDVR